MYIYPSAAMSHSISYRSLISGGIFFACILIYSALDIGVSKKKNFSSQDINLAPLHASEMVLLNSSSNSKRDAVGDDEPSGYLSLSLPTVNMTLYVSDFSGK